MASSILLAVISSSVFSQASALASSSAHPAAEAGAAIGARARTVSTARIMDLSPAKGAASAGLRTRLCKSS
jgi:putative effector of murein hydrolase